jgi:TetR/AcrR family transcriptional regulator
MSSQTRDGRSARRPRPAGRPPGATGEGTRDEILDAALQAFAEAGFEAMSVRELTRRLGVSHNLVHHHFGSKEDLWRAALDHGVGPTAEDLIKLLGERVGSRDSKQILQQGLARAFELLARRPAVVRILADESTRPGPRLDYLFERYLGPLVEMLSRFLTESRAHGLRDLDSRIAALFVLGSASAQFTHDALAEKLGLGPATQPHYTKSLVDLIMGGLVATDPDSQTRS